MVVGLNCAGIILQDDSRGSLLAGISTINGPLVSYQQVASHTPYEMANRINKLLIAHRDSLSLCVNTVTTILESHSVPTSDRRPFLDLPVSLAII